MIYPSVKTLPSYVGRIQVPAKAGGVRNYNGSVIRHQRRLLHCWRAEDSRGTSSLWIGELDGLKIRKAKQLQLGEGFDAEDPRLFHAPDGRLLLMWSKVRDTRHDAGSWHVVQMLADIVGLKASNPREWTLDCIRTQYVEKNWTPLPDGGVIYHFGTGMCVGPDGRFRKGRPTRMPWGSFSGGTPAVEWPERGTWLAIYHGFTDHPTRVKRYYFGALEIDPSTYEIIRMSRRPIVWASDEDETIPCPRDPLYNPSVVFPCGLVRDGDDWLVTAGIHDSWDALFRFTEADLELVPVTEAEANTRWVVAPDAPVPSEAILVRVVGQSVGEPGGPYHKGECFVTTPLRANALGPLVEIVSKEVCHA